MKSSVAIVLIILGALFLLVPAVADCIYYQNRANALASNASVSSLPVAMGNDRFFYYTVGLFMLACGVAGSFERHRVPRVISTARDEAA